MPPSIGDVVLAVVAVLAGCVAGAAAVRGGYLSGNWFAYICAAGCAAFVAGIVGQRVFPSADAIRTLGTEAAARSVPGPWDAGVSLPLLPIRLTPVTVAGILVAAVGLSLVLLFERVPGAGRAAARRPRRLEEDDTV